MFFYIFFMAFLMSGCSEKLENVEDKSPKDLLSLAQLSYKEKNFLRAARIFDEIDRQHPYSDDALTSLLMAGECYYLCKKYDEAIERFRSFIELHPGYEKIDYAYYMIGICYYEQIPIVERDQTPCLESKSAFEELLNRFPQSPYSKDAKMKMNLLNDHLAAKEMDIGRYYQIREHSPQSAIARYKIVVDAFQTTPQIQEALYRLVECYISLGLLSEAQKYASILGHNYQNSSWYEKAFRLCQNCCPKSSS